MSFQVALNFEDGITRFVECRPGETVAEASYKARINIPLDCRDGACGTCKSRCDAGTYDGGDYIDEALTEEEAALGYCLPCQMTPHSDLVLRIPSTSAAAKTGPAGHTATVAAVEHLSATTAEIVLDVDDRQALDFLPGQYVNIAVPGTGESRSYSFSSGPHRRQTSFLVRIVPGGAMSGYLAERARPGDRLEFTGPLGGFYLRPLVRPALLLAGGTGLAPLLSMLDRLTANPAGRQPVRLLYGVTTDEDLVHLSTLERYSAALPSFTFDHCVADPASTARTKGYVTGLMDTDTLHGGDTDVYLCGPPAMVEAVRGHIAALGVTPAGFHYEKFTPAAVREKAAVA
ncbi:benzoate 1,2-dioxygenase electron transfer component BenC [Streptomyces qinzhouensis]|uniref:Ring-hydroxylating dioxygenase ferredoxin reductase family protein n=1 Tax=Streptomyces qinzhouensis TaxID=2599401 RepID=A0A5B8J317_9ACTN|nr:benzoate 1,2-dioxygenase electron transfer component BenC [Streptomyces qinzhouensis]QDY75607.1 ring-hydroxylating dioxygenase ferredoxin reductase family protein [Streptomyces qinzhouensis]